jgi:hypothetical protein
MVYYNSLTKIISSLIHCYKKKYNIICYDKNNYHTPRDRSDSIDYKVINTVANFAKQIIEELGADPKEPDFRKIEKEKPYKLTIVLDGRVMEIEVE